MKAVTLNHLDIYNMFITKNLSRRHKEHKGKMNTNFFLPLCPL